MKIEEKVFDLLMSAKFEKWYQKAFIPFVEGDETAPSEADVLNWLANELE